MKKFIVFLMAAFVATSLIAQVNVTISTYSNVTCNGLCNGTASANITGGTPPYTIVWNSVPAQTTAVVTGVCAGTYSVTVTDNIGLTGTASVTIGQPSPVVAVVTPSNTCGSFNGSASVYVTGGYSPYYYVWSNNVGTGSTANNLSTGTYTVTVCDVNNCCTNQSFTILQGPNPITDISVETNPAFCGSSVGAAWVTSVTGGTPNYMYTWSNAAIGQTITNLSPGNYCVTATDATGCNISDCVTIADSMGFEIIVDSVSHSNCANNQLGYIGIHISGGQGGFGISWSPGGMTTPTIDNLLPGNYTVTVFDSTSWCIIQETVNIQQTYNLYATVNTVQANCGSNGIATVYANGIHPPFSFLWNDPLAQTDSIADSLATGQYQVTITDAIGCTIIASANITQYCLNVIKGCVYVDANSNCIRDPGEQGFAGLNISTVSGGFYTLTDTGGYYELHIPMMNNSVQIFGNSSCYDFACPVNNSQPANFISLGDTLSNINFALIGGSSSFDLSIHPGWTSAHPGFQKRYWFLYSNTGCGPVDATVNFVYDPVLQYNSCTNGGVHDLVNHKITWTINNLAPGTYWNWMNLHEALFTVPVGTSISDSIDNYFEILPITGDILPNNNIVNVTEPITGSHDPNDKQVFPRGIGADGCILPEDSVLFYTIRFQNDGNDTAFTVVVVDTLSTRLNPATFVAGAASHPYTVSMSGEGILIFRFDNILLPDSNVDVEGSQGYFNFTVHTDPGLAWNTVISNNAAIYFDFNEPVITNTVINTLCDPLFSGMIPAALGVTVFPNPTTGTSVFTLNGDIPQNGWELKLYDLPGKEIINSGLLKETSYSMTLPENRHGIYLYQIISMDGKVVNGKIVVE